MFAFVLVVFFHVFTRVLFPIGMFPYVMIVGSLIFFDAKVHLKIISIIKSIFSCFKIKFTFTSGTAFTYPRQNLAVPIVLLFFVIQLLIPFRYALYPGELFWREDAYRFSWRVMLMEKKGYANFKVVNPEKDSFFYVDNSDFLSSFQEKQMSTQPDFILEYAHFLGEHFKAQGHQPIEIYVESYVALNGRRSQPYINPEVDLLKQYESFQPKSWILPFKDEIKGI